MFHIEIAQKIKVDDEINTFHGNLYEASGGVLLKEITGTYNPQRMELISLVNGDVDVIKMRGYSMEDLTNHHVIFYPPNLEDLVFQNR